MRGKIKESTKANYAIMFWIGLILSMCLVFEDEFIGSDGTATAVFIRQYLGYLGYIIVAGLVLLSFAKVVFSFKILRISRPLLAIATTLSILLLTAIFDVGNVSGATFGGLISYYIAYPTLTYLGVVETYILLTLLAAVFISIAAIEMLKVFRIDIIKIIQTKRNKPKTANYEKPQYDDAQYGIENRIEISDAQLAIENREEMKGAKVLETGYVPPSIANLAQGSSGVQVVTQDELYHNAEVITSVLQSGKIEAKVPNVVIGTSVIRYEIAIKNSADIERVMKMKMALLSRLQVESISIELPILGKDRVGISLPNPYRQTVTLKQLLTDEKYVKSPKTAVALGRDVSGNVVICDLAKMPHLLIAGSTGMGKSVCLNAIIVSLLYHASPSEIKLILIDPKRVEFNSYSGVPHLMREIVNTADDALEVLTDAVAETERRYGTLAKHRTKDIDSYNAIAEEKLPKIIIIIDELAELMVSGDIKKEIEIQIQRLSQKARAAGIHLVVATQRPSVDVITGVIKSNLPSRIAFKLSNGVDSKTILDESGAEDLLGKGDMFYKPATAANKLRVQGAYVSDSEIEKIVNEVIANNPMVNNAEAEVVEVVSSSVIETPMTMPKREPTTSDIMSECGIEPELTIILDPEEKRLTDETFEEKAWREIKNFKEISVGRLQSIYSISYSKAMELLEQFADMELIKAIDDENYVVVE